MGNLCFGLTWLILSIVILCHGPTLSQLSCHGRRMLYSTCCGVDPVGVVAIHVSLTAIIYWCSWADAACKSQRLSLSSHKCSCVCIASVWLQRCMPSCGLHSHSLPTSVVAYVLKGDGGCLCIKGPHGVSYVLKGFTPHCLGEMLN